MDTRLQWRQPMQTLTAAQKFSRARLIHISSLRAGCTASQQIKASSDWGGLNNSKPDSFMLVF